MLKPENVVKGRIAEVLVEQLLREAGFIIYRTGIEHLFEFIIQRREDFNSTESVFRGLSAFPDFLVEGFDPAIEPKKTLFFVEVKYRKDGILKPEDEGPFKEKYIILVSSKNPYFQIKYVGKELSGKDNEWKPLKDDYVFWASSKIPKKWIKVRTKEGEIVDALDTKKSREEFWEKIYLKYINMIVDFFSDYEDTYESGFQEGQRWEADFGNP